MYLPSLPYEHRHAHARIFTHVVTIVCMHQTLAPHTPSHAPDTAPFPSCLQARAFGAPSARTLMCAQLAKRHAAMNTHCRCGWRGTEGWGCRVQDSHKLPLQRAGRGMGGQEAGQRMGKIGVHKSRRGGTTPFGFSSLFAFPCISFSWLMESQHVGRDAHTTVASHAICDACHGSRFAMHAASGPPRV